MKLRKMFDDDKGNFAVLFLGTSEIEQKFEGFKPKKASESDLAHLENLRIAYNNSTALITEVENFKKSSLTSCIEKAVSSKFEIIITKHNSGGNLKDLNSELHAAAEEIVKEKIQN